MPVMPRPKGQAKKIAYAVLGVPQNMEQPRKRRKKRQHDERVAYDATIRER